MGGIERARYRKGPIFFFLFLFISLMISSQVAQIITRVCFSLLLGIIGRYPSSVFNSRKGVVLMGLHDSQMQRNAPSVEV